MHEGPDEGQLIIFLLSQKGQLAFPEAVEHDARVGNEQVVAHQQEAALFGGVLQTLRMHPNPHQLNQSFNIKVHDGPVEFTVLFLRFVQVHHAADHTQKEKRQQK